MHKSSKGLAKEIGAHNDTAKVFMRRTIDAGALEVGLVTAGWNISSQIREEVSFTKGRIIVRGKMVSRGEGKRADYILSAKPNIPIAIIEANHPRRGRRSLLPAFSWRIGSALFCPIDKARESLSCDLCHARNAVQSRSAAA